MIIKVETYIFECAYCGVRKRVEVLDEEPAVHSLPKGWIHEWSSRKERLVCACENKECQNMLGCQ